jgi:hypothetical protein
LVRLPLLPEFPEHRHETDRFRSETARIDDTANVLGF